MPTQQAHQNLLSDLKKITTTKSFDRFFKYVSKKNYTKALLILCQKCKNDDNTRLQLIATLLNYKDRIQIHLNKKDKLGKSPIFYAVENPSIGLFNLLKDAGVDVNQQLAGNYTLLDAHRYNIKQKILSNLELTYKQQRDRIDKLFNDLPSKESFQRDRDNAQYDLQRLEFILQTINHISHYYDLAAGKRILVTFNADEFEIKVISDVTLEQARNNLERISITIRNLSGEFRERYKKLFGPAPFTWHTFEQLGGLVRIKNNERYILLPMQLQLSNLQQSFPDVFLRLYDECRDLEEVVEDAVPSIVSMDLPILHDFFELILNSQNRLQDIPIPPISLIAIKAFTSHIGDTLTLYNLLNLFNYSEHEESKLYEKNQLTYEQTFLINPLSENNKSYQQRFDLSKKSGQHAALRRLQAIGELCTGKKLSREITDLDDTIDWGAFVTVRDGLCHPDERDNKYKIDLLLSDISRLERIVGDEFSEFWKKIPQLLKMRESQIGKYEHDSQKRWLQILQRYTSKISSHANDEPEEAQAVTRRVSEVDEKLFIDALIEKMAPKEIIDECRNIFAGIAPIPNKKIQGEIFRYLPPRSDNKERYKKLTAIFPKTDAVQTTEKERNLKRQALEAEAKKRELEKESRFIFFPTLRELAKLFKQDPITEHLLNPLKRISLAIEALENIEEFLLEEGYLIKGHPYQTLKDWDRYHTLKGRKQLAHQLELNRQLNDAIEYNAGHLLQHLDRIKHFSEAQFCSYLNEDYEAIRTLRNYIEHGDPLRDTVGYDVICYEKGELRQQTILKTVIELIFNLKPPLHIIRESMIQKELNIQPAVSNPKDAEDDVRPFKDQGETNTVAIYSGNNNTYAPQFFNKAVADVQINNGPNANIARSRPQSPQRKS
ncbi:Uncharacterised protein [Legionella busanensis]|uniref:Uncharacterized protein n=1 Tax=Legionella busanensis TaxID=190655 RepID=A0A378JH21_9GAMM|nr:hypothetical protein [Legionella busanensis]STX50297.1 Uncharacterised protein [Legionella busanensis]